MKKVLFALFFVFFVAVFYEPAFAAGNAAPEVTHLLMNYTDTAGVAYSHVDVKTNGTEGLSIDYSEDYSFEVYVDHPEIIKELYVTSTVSGDVSYLKASWNDDFFITNGKFNNSDSYVPENLGISFSQIQSTASMTDDSEIAQYIPIYSSDYNPSDNVTVVASEDNYSAVLDVTELMESSMLSEGTKILLKTEISIYDDANGTMFGLASENIKKGVKWAEGDFSDYLTILDYSDPSTYTMLLKDLSGNKYVEMTISAIDEKLGGLSDECTLQTVSDRLGMMSDVFGALDDFVSAKYEAHKLKEQVEAAGHLTDEQRQELNRRIDTLANDKWMFNVAGTVLTTAIAFTPAGATAMPVMMFGAMMNFINTSADYFWDYRLGLIEAELEENEEGGFRINETMGSGKCGDQLYWSLRYAGESNDIFYGTLSIVGRGDMYDYPMVQPWWRCAFDNGFSNYSYPLFKIGHINLSSNITGIGKCAFAGAWIDSIQLPLGLTQIRDDAFSSCIKLEEVALPDTVTEVGEKAFYNCSEIKFVRLGDGIETLGKSAFERCSAISNVDFGLSPINIGESAFRFCTSLASVDFSPNTLSIGNHAFDGCTSLAGSLLIPSKVTSLGYWAFRDCSSLSQVTMGSALTTFSSAFVGCTGIVEATVAGDMDATGEIESVESLTFTGNSIENGTLWKSAFPSVQEVVVAQGVKEIGEGAFSGWSELETISLPDTLETIGPLAFWGTGLTELILPDSVESIQECAFMECTSLASITIPESVEQIGDSAFAKCYSLKSVILSTGLTGIGDQAFYSSGLTSIIIPDSVKVIGDYAFYDCDGLATVTIPGTVTSIGEGILAYSGSLSSVMVSNGITSIPAWSFAFCSNLSHVEIPDSVTSIGALAFSGCSSLEGITLPDKLEGIGRSAFSDCIVLESMALPSSISIIGDNLFYGCFALTSVSVPASLTTIEYNAFYNCVALKDIYYSGTEEQWSKIEIDSDGNDMLLAATVHYSDEVPSGEDTGGGSSDFIIADGILIKYNGQDEDVVIPANVTGIGPDTFLNCSFIQSVTIPTSVRSIGKDAFLGCIDLKNIYITDLSAWCNIAFSNNRANPLFNMGNLVLNGNQLDTLIIPDGVTTIGDYAFFGCAGVEKLVLSDDVTSIGACAFSSCRRLAGLTIPSSVTSLGTGAFSNCYNLIRLAISPGLTSIGVGAFSGCDSLLTVIIPNSLTRIDSFAFYQSSPQMEVYYSGNEEQWNKIKIEEKNDPLQNSILHFDCGPNSSNPDFVIVDGTLTRYVGLGGAVVLPNNVTRIGDYAFAACSDLLGITIPDSVLSIGEGAFLVCNGLSCLTIPESVTSIETGSFSACSFLNNIIIPQSITTIEAFAFADCTNLRSVTIPASVADIKEGAFDYCNSLTDIFFLGNEPQWEEIRIDNYNEGIMNAELHCISSDESQILITESVQTAYGETKIAVLYCGEDEQISAFGVRYDVDGRFLGVEMTSLAPGEIKELIVPCNGATIIRFFALDSDTSSPACAAVDGPVV